MRDTDLRSRTDIAREPGLVGGSRKQRGLQEVNESFKHSVFHLSLEKMPCLECNVRLMIAVLRATRECMRELIWDRELASLHQLEKVRHVRMLEKQAAWKREGGFDRIEIIAEMYEKTLRRLHAGFDSKPFILDCTTLNDHPTVKNLCWKLTLR